MFRFLRREWRLLEARRALLAGAPERALHDLEDPLVEEHPRALRLRHQALEGLFHQAAGAAERGRDQSVLRLLGIAEGVDPDRARRWRHTLVPPEPEAPPEPQPDPTGSRYLTGILDDLRRQRDAGDPRAGEAAPGEGGPGDPDPSRAPMTPRGPRSDRSRAGALDAETRERVRAGRGARWRMVVDEGGEWLVCDGARVSLGHARSGLSDVPLLAGVDPLHALLERRESFHGGTRWVLVSLGGADAAVDGRRADVEPQELVDGSELHLGRGVRLRFHAPDPGSASATLELLGGLEAEGAQRVLLLAPGPGGRVRVGPYLSRHVVVPRMDHEVELVREPDALTVRCEGGVRVMGEPADAGDAPDVQDAPDADADADEPDAGADRAVPERARVPLPLAGRVDLALGARPDQTFPFGLSLEPLEGPGPVPEGEA